MADLDIQMQRVVNKAKSNIYPITVPKNVNVTPKNKIPSSATNMQKVLDSMGDMAFSNGDDVVYITDGSDAGSFEAPVTEVDDSVVSLTKTWSSAKIKALFELLGVTFDSKLNGTVTKATAADETPTDQNTTNDETPDENTTV